MKRQRPFSPVEVTEEDYRNLLRNHKRKKLMTSQVQGMNGQSCISLYMYRKFMHIFSVFYNPGVHCAIFLSMMSLWLNSSKLDHQSSI